MSEAPATKPRMVRLPKEVRGDWPLGHLYSAGPGDYEAEVNYWGAVSVLTADGSRLGVKPGEFEWLGDFVCKKCGESAPLLEERVRRLTSALERCLHNFKALLAQKPVRDAAETVAEAERVLEDKK